jgi:putative ABC transport system permease protein
MQDPLRSSASVLGIALGIAVVVAVHLANMSSFRGFEAAVESVTGKTSLEIAAPGPGLDETLLPWLDWLGEYGAVSPVIEGDALARAGNAPAETIRVLGIDILSDWPFREYHILQFRDQRREPAPKEILDLLIDPRSIILTEAFARQHGIGVGSKIELTIADRVDRFVVRGLLLNEGPARTLGGNFALMDIAAAQAAFNRLGRLDRIDLRLAPGISIDSAEQTIASRLPRGLIVRRPERRGRQVEKMLRAFQFNLAALSHIALLVGLFLIYNTVSISVITRREEIGMLRALGTSRRRILALFLGEAAGLAAVGCGIGVLIGRALADGAVRLTSTTVSAFYIAEAAAPPHLTAEHVVLAFAVGIPLALAAAAIPAAEAARAQPTTAARGSDRLRLRFHLRRVFFFGPAFLPVVAFFMTKAGPVDGLPVFGYAAAVVVVFAGALAVPLVLYGMGKMGNGVLARLFKTEGLLANANLTGAIGRLTISIAALAVSLAMMVAIAVMIGSFRTTIITWVGQTMRADLYIRPATRVNVATDVTISPEVEAVVSSHPSVAAVDRFRTFDVSYRDSLVTLGAGDFRVLLEHGNLAFKSPRNGLEEMRRALGRNAVVASESFAIKYRKAPGDLVMLPTPQGFAQFRIAAVYYDYSSDRGVLIMDRPLLVRYFGPQAPTSLNVYVKKGADPEAVRSDILAALGGRYRLLFYTNSLLREEVLRVFDSTFSITYALEIIAIFIAILGVASTLVSLMLERRREFAILRLIGAERRQIRKMVVIEAGFMGLISQGIGIAVGLLLSLILIYVINVQSFGWTIQFHLPAGFLLRSSILIVIATALSGLYPAHRACRLSAPVQIKEE